MLMAWEVYFQKVSRVHRHERNTTDKLDSKSRPTHTHPHTFWHLCLTKHEHTFTRTENTYVCRLPEGGVFEKRRVNI